MGASNIGWGMLLLTVGCASAAPASSDRDVAIPPPPATVAPATAATGTTHSEELVATITAPAIEVRAPTQPPPAGSAQPSMAEAESLFEEGRKAMAAGQLPQACSLFERSLKADPAIGTMMNLAACRERLADLPEACRWYREGVKLARIQNQSERAKFAEAKANDLHCP